MTSELAPSLSRVQPAANPAQPIRVVLACGCLRPELESLQPAARRVQVKYLPQSLHRSPQRMTAALQSAINQTDQAVPEIALAYGLCSNGVVGLRAPQHRLRIPRVHDCIALYLGSRGAYAQAFRRRAGSYYLTAGWVAEQKDPLGTLRNEYVARVGWEDADWAIREELKHYTHIVPILSPGCDPEPLRRCAKQNARFLDKEYEEIRGDLGYLRRVLFGPYDEEGFICVEPGTTVTQDPFLE